METLLSIAIPTYNRAAFLEPLVRFLLEEIDALEGRSEMVEVLVSDNCSTDRTEDVIQRFAGSVHLKTFRHSSNLGADANIASLWENACGRYVWILGDDDRPVAGCIKSLLDHVRDHEPGIIFLKGSASKALPAIGEQQRFAFESVNRPTFYRLTGIDLTFLSSIVMHRATAMAISTDFVPPENLKQLRWVFPCVASDLGHAVSMQIVLHVTAENTGAYDVVATFGVGYPAAVKGYFGSGLDSQLLLREFRFRFMPYILYELRFGGLGSRALIRDESWDEFRAWNKESRLFCWICAPIATVPKAPAFFLKFLSLAGQRIEKHLEVCYWRWRGRKSQLPADQVG
jgi:abequosyltransferase